MDDLVSSTGSNDPDIPNNYDSTFNLNFETGFFENFINTFTSSNESANIILGWLSSYDPTYGTLGVKIGSQSANVTSPIKMLNNFQPVLNKPVWLLKIGTDYLALGQQRYDANSFLDSWTTWDSTAPNGAMAFTSTCGWTRNNGTMTGKYLQIGKTVFVAGTYEVGSSDIRGTVGNGGMQFTLPIDCADQMWQGTGRGQLKMAGTTTNVPVSVTPLSANAVRLDVLNVTITALNSTTYIARSSIHSTNYTIEAGNTITFNCVYESV